jgi:hypothetical protein
MQFKSVRLFLFIILSGLSSVGAAEPTVASGAPGTFMLPSFELNYLNANQGSGDNSSTAQVSWAPLYRFTPMFAVRGNVGVSALRGHNMQNEQMTFAMFDFELLARLYVFGNFDVEAGGGVQNWVQQGGSAGAFTVNFGFHPTVPLLTVLNRFFIGYTNVDQATNVSEFRAGLTASF